MASLPTPSKPCHNCRRQRLRCDRSYPHCNKCVTLGKECLGYGRLLRWTGAVASRGKLAGHATSAAASGSAGLESTASPSPALSSGSPASSRRRATAKQSHVRRSASGRRAASGLQPEGSGVRMVPWSPQEPRHEPLQLSAPKALIDPLFQDMSSPYRYYLSHFVGRLCQDLVSYDLPEHNPFRRLAPLTRAHPLLQHVVVAVSAAHMSNLMRRSASTALLSSPVGDETASRRALAHSLVAKHKALHLMHMALQNIDTVGEDIVFAAAVWLVNLELIESGKKSWKAHLEGAANIMTLLPPAQGSSEALRDYLLSDCFIYFILGSTLMPARSSSHGNFPDSQIQLILQRATSNCYLSCPPDIMAILYAASRLSNAEADGQVGDGVTRAALSLLQRAQKVEIYEWARTIHSAAHLEVFSIDSRVHAAWSHLFAACLYILRAIPSVTAMVDEQTVRAFGEGLIHHLESVPDADPNFKATTWPSFIAGAEAREPERRRWAMDRLHRLFLRCPWGFLYTAMEAVQAIWDSQGAEEEDRSWVQLLKNSGEYYLIV